LKAAIKYLVVKSSQRAILGTLVLGKRMDRNLRRSLVFILKRAILDFSYDILLGGMKHV